VLTQDFIFLPGYNGNFSVFSSFPWGSNSF